MQSVKCLTKKQEDLSSNPQQPHQKSGVAAWHLIPRDWFDASLTGNAYRMSRCINLVFASVISYNDISLVVYEFLMDGGREWSLKTCRRELDDSLLKERNDKAGKALTWGPPLSSGIWELIKGSMCSQASCYSFSCQVDTPRMMESRWESGPHQICLWIHL